jgi:aminoglycoside phosphotransferase (APT) family kinase protein
MVLDSSAFQSALRVALANETGSEIQISGLNPVAGGSSQETWRFDLSVASGPWQGEYHLILRRPLGGKIIATALDLAAEFTVLRAAFASGVPSPHPYWFFPELLGRPALLMDRLEGETIGRRIVKERELTQARTRLPKQMGLALAAIHAVDLDAYHLRATLPAPGQTPAQARIAQFEADLDRIDEPHPALELSIRWLRRHEPQPPDRLVLVHGDFRIGNIVANREGLVGILDWEFAHLGDPAEDFGWPLVRSWRFGVDHLRFGGVGSPEVFLAAYEQASGQRVDPARVFYWEVMGNVGWAIGALNQARRHLSGQEPNLEFASLGRRCAEMELEALLLIKSTMER